MRNTPTFSIMWWYLRRALKYLRQNVFKEKKVFQENKNIYVNLNVYSMLMNLKRV